MTHGTMLGQITTGGYLNQIVAIAIGGAGGALARYALANGVYHLLGRDFPYGTLAVNVLGSLLMGFLYVWLTERALLGPEWRGAILVGFLGSFTTFSTFSMETVALFEEHAYLRASLNIALSLVICVAAAWSGVLVARRL